MSLTKWIYWFDELGKEHSGLVGKKCANLGELTKGGFRVPPGFALVLEAYKRFLTRTGAIEEIRRYLDTFTADPNNPRDIPKYEEASKVIRGIVESKAMPTDMQDEIVAYYDELCQRTGIDAVPVATRSAGPESHPGQYETFLHVRGESDVIQKIVKVWASTFNTRSLMARARGGLLLEYDPIGVGVLKMTNARVAGVMFTLNTTNGDNSKITIEGSWGLGESVVSGRVVPDYWMVDKVRLEITKVITKKKLTQCVYDLKTKSAVFEDIPPEMQDILCLTSEEVIELARLGKEIEKHYGCAQDIEWAIDQDLEFPRNVFLLQTRPETIWSKVEKKPVLGTQSSAIKTMVHRLTHIKR
ncbi:MAG: PEP/pyruvate-binding domain-containing protein [Pseudomonadota bacterium]